MLAAAIEEFRAKCKLIFWPSKDGKYWTWQRESFRAVIKTTRFLGRIWARRGYPRYRLDRAALSLYWGMNRRHKSSHMLACGHRGTAKLSPSSWERQEGEVTLIKLVVYENGVMPIGSMWQGFIKPRLSQPCENDFLISSLFFVCGELYSSLCRFVPKGLCVSGSM